ncbi:MAG: MarR family transcriptional regulator [Archangium sp.]|nr:MarR family transcriptional regulator [Archangium sp.]
MTYGEQVGSLRRTLHRAIVLHVAERSDRPITQLMALRVIASSEVKTQAELAERLLIDAPAASRMVAGLERDGLIKRTVGEDRRCVCLQVTAAAKKEVAIIDEGLQWLEREVRSHLTQKEFDTSKALLKKLQVSMASGK